MLIEMPSTISVPGIWDPQYWYFGYCPHPVSVYIRVPLRAIYNHMRIIIQLLVNGGSSRLRTVWKAKLAVRTCPIRSLHQAPNSDNGSDRHSERYISLHSPRALNPKILNNSFSSNHWPLSFCTLNPKPKACRPLWGRFEEVIYGGYAGI